MTAESLPADGNPPATAVAVTPAAPVSLVGQTLGGRYRVTGLIGSGGMGAVYRAEHIELQKPVALKVLNAEMALHKEAALRFEREAMVSARIAHPHVVSATDSGRLPDGSLYLVLEFVPGRSLREVLEQEGRLPLARALAIAGQIAEALAAAHAAEIVHRDLKPGNVMLLQQEGNPEFVKVLDFGLARMQGQAGPGEPLTRTGAIFGTPEYMAPEQARGEVVDHRADLYALGVILYELLAGRPPFQSQELVAVLIKHLQEAPPPLPADIPAPLAAYVMALLEKQASRRPADALQVVKALRRLLPAPLPFSQAPLAPAPAAGLALGAWRARGSAALRQLPVLAQALQERLARANEALFAGHPARRWAGRATLAVALLGAITLAWLKRGDSQLAERARQGEPKALHELAAVPSAKRTGEASLALALGYFSAGKTELGLDALNAALSADPDLKDHPDLLRGVRRAVDEPATRERALELAATRLGAPGVDLLFDVWRATNDKTPATRAARKWLDTDSVRAGASPAAKLALELRETKGCSALRELLPQAQREADDRSLLPLRRLQSKSGCGFLGLEDCYGCLRDDAALERAIQAATDRPGPRFDGP